MRDGNARVSAGGFTEGVDISQCRQKFGMAHPELLGAFDSLAIKLKKNPVVLGIKKELSLFLEELEVIGILMVHWSAKQEIWQKRFEGVYGRQPIIL